MKRATPNRKKSGFSETLKQQKWLTLIALPILLFATFNEIYSLWGILFIYWGISSVVSGSAYLVESIDQQNDPALFWIITVMWIGFGVLYVLTDFYPTLLL